MAPDSCSAEPSTCAAPGRSARRSTTISTAGDDDVVVDLTDVDSVDLTALKVLAVATRQASRLGRHLILRGCGPAVRRLLHLSRLIRVVEVEREVATV